MNNADKIKLRASGKYLSGSIRKIKLLKKNLPLTDITIHNMCNDRPYYGYDVKCDRSSPLGSPFYLMGDESHRNLVCDQYQEWFNMIVLTNTQTKAYQELIRLKALYKKHNKLRIFCWCAPKKCHCETIKNWLKENK